VQTNYTLLNRRVCSRARTHPAPGARAIASALSLIVSLSACSGGDIVEGRMLHTPEFFSGTAGDGWRSGASLSVTSSKGTKCVGRYTKGETAGSSIAVMNCDDGRTGSVFFTDSPHESVGTGMLGTDIVTLTIDE
jgi:hypothetical protein